MWRRVVEDAREMGDDIARNPSGRLDRDTILDFFFPVVNKLVSLVTTFCFFSRSPWSPQNWLQGTYKHIFCFGAFCGIWTNNLSCVLSLAGLQSKNCEGLDVATKLIVVMRLNVVMRVNMMKIKISTTHPHP